MQRLIFLCVLTLPVSSTAQVLAQRGYTALTAEYLAATSDLIVRGTISDLMNEENIRGDNINVAAAETTTSVSVLLDVTRCLKGTTDNSIRIHIAETPGFEQLAEWKNSKRELFWFFDVSEIDENGITNIIPRTDLVRWGPCIEPPDLHADRPPIMLLDVHLQPLTTEKMVEDTIVKYVKTFGPGRIDGVRKSISRDIASRTGMHQAANMVMLPMNYKDVRSK